VSKRKNNRDEYAEALAVEAIGNARLFHVILPREVSVDSSILVPYRSKPPSQLFDEDVAKRIEYEMLEYEAEDCKRLTLRHWSRGFLTFYIVRPYAEDSLDLNISWAQLCGLFLLLETPMVLDDADLEALEYRVASEGIRWGADEHLTDAQCAKVYDWLWRCEPEALDAVVTHGWVDDLAVARAVRATCNLQPTTQEAT